LGVALGVRIVGVGSGAWKAPAGTEAHLRGAIDVEVNLTDMENGILNK